MTRLMPSSRDAVFHCPPLVASAIELDNELPRPGSQRWAIVHSITEQHLKLIHGHPIQAERIALRIPSPGGEIVEIIVAVSQSQSLGDLFETWARFIAADPAEKRAGTPNESY